MPGRQQNVSARRRFPESSLSRDFQLPLLPTADTSVHVLDPHVSKPAGQMARAELKDSIQKRQRPAEVSTVLMTTGVYNGDGIASWTEDQKAPHNTKQKELLKVEVVDRRPSQQVFSTRWVQKQRLDGSYINANCGKRI